MQAVSFDQSEIALCQPNDMKKTADILSGFADRMEIAIQQSRYNKNLMK